MLPSQETSPSPRRVQFQSNFDHGRFRPFWIAPNKAQRRVVRWKVCNQWSFLVRQE
jgi:hypothetical protein